MPGAGDGPLVEVQGRRLAFLQPLFGDPFYDAELGSVLGGQGPLALVLDEVSRAWSETGRWSGYEGFNGDGLFLDSDGIGVVALGPTL